MTIAQTDFESSGNVIRKVSLVEQIARQLRKEILTQVFPPDSEFPSEKALAERFGTSHMTVRGALKMLAQEGLIEIAHGKRNIVKDFKINAGIDIFPEMLVACPAEVVTPAGYAIFQRHVFWLYDQILINAALHAKLSDKADLRKKARAFVKAKGLEEIWNKNIEFVRRILAISDNVVLMMYFNSYTRTHQRLLELGMIKETVYPVPDYEKTLYQLIDAICANDRKEVRKIGMQLQFIAQQDSDLWYQQK